MMLGREGTKCLRNHVLHAGMPCHRSFSERLASTKVKSEISNELSIG